jgi:aspartokinase
MLIESDKGLMLSLLVEEIAGKSCDHTSECAVLSIFPHKNDPEILIRLMDAFHSNSVKPEAIATSPSTISIVLQENDLNRASTSLFGPFSFSAYRTPEDWSLAQKGKEHIYKEIIATYQEKRPKVYGLEYYIDQQINYINLQNSSLLSADVPHEDTSNRPKLTFAASYPDHDCSEEILGICLSNGSDKGENSNIVFSMNGPHFGDRYGISYELLNSLEKRNVDIRCLGCTIASITGVIESSQLDQTIEGIKDCFDVPIVVQK